MHFVRHAEPDFSIKDDMTRPLTEKGIADTKKVTKALLGREISAVYSSPFKRTVDTIKDFADSSGFEVRTMDSFRERRVGEWLEDLKAYSKKQWEDFNFKLIEGECLREVQERNISVLFDVIEANLGRV